MNNRSSKGVSVRPKPTDTPLRSNPRSRWGEIGERGERPWGGSRKEDQASFCNSLQKHQQRFGVLSNHNTVLG